MFENGVIRKNDFPESGSFFLFFLFFFGGGFFRCADAGAGLLCGVFIRGRGLRDVFPGARGFFPVFLEERLKKKGV